MPDITMCMNSECPRCETCYRYKAEATPMWQTYAGFDCKEDKPYTDMYWPVEPSPAQLPSEDAVGDGAGTSQVLDSIETESKE